MKPLRHSLLLCLGAFATFGLQPAMAAEIALSFGSADYVDTDQSLRKITNKGTLDFKDPLTPASGYHGPVFYGSYGRSANGSVDNARIINKNGPYGQDMIDFSEGAMGVVDQIYGVVIFRPESFEGRFKDQAISLARSEALSIRTYTGFSPDQVGWFHFYIEVGDQAFVSPPFSFTNDVDDQWGEKNITVNDPRTIKWTEAVFRDGTPFLAGNRPEATPDFDAVTAVGFVFHTAATENSTTTTARFLTDFFLVAAE